MFYVESDNKIVLFDENREKLENVLCLIPEYSGLEIKETDRPIINYEYADTPEWEEKQAEKEKQRIANLSLTKREVFLALFRDKGITPEQLKAQITDPEALIEFEYAEKYYRFNPLINGIGALLGYTPAQLDYLFEHKELPNED